MSVVRIILILLQGFVIYRAALAAENPAFRQQKAIVAGLCEASRVRLTRVLTNLGIAASSWYRRSVPREQRRRPGPSPQPIDRDFPFAVPETTILLIILARFQNQDAIPITMHASKARSGPFLLVGAPRRASARHPAQHQPSQGRDCHVLRPIATLDRVAPTAAVHRTAGLTPRSRRTTRAAPQPRPSETSRTWNAGRPSHRS